MDVETPMGTTRERASWREVAAPHLTCVSPRWACATGRRTSGVCAAHDGHRRRLTGTGWDFCVDARDDIRAWDLGDVREGQGAAVRRRAIRRS
jgi:hypothetical protein